jgi:leucine dehydrogenase
MSPKRPSMIGVERTATPFELEEFDGHEDVVFFADDAAGLRAILALHDTTLGPGLGGCRVFPYGSPEEALRDVLKLSRAMTYKAACAGVPFGGGKCVVIADPDYDKSTELLLALGGHLARFDGTFYLGEDVGTSTQDMAVIHRRAPNVVGLPEEMGGSGDPSVWTAEGCVVGMQAAVKFALGLDSMADLRVVVQGVGNVGRRLARALAARGARLAVSDVRTDLATEVAAECGAEVVPPDGIFDVEGDVFAPCALGGVLNHTTVGRLRARVIAGCANNQLAAPAIGEALTRRGILYVPDYVINAGGMIRLAAEILEWAQDRLRTTIDNIGATLTSVFELSLASQIPTAEAADNIARVRLRGDKTSV